MNICQRCNGCGWDNPAQAIDLCPACGGSGKDGRERLTMAHLHVQTLEINRQGKRETSITRDELNDLKRDMEFINLFNWTTSDGVLQSFVLNGVIVVVKYD